MFVGVKVICALRYLPLFLCVILVCVFFCVGRVLNKGAHMYRVCVCIVRSCCLLCARVFFTCVLFVCGFICVVFIVRCVLLCGYVCPCVCSCVSL